VGTDLSKLHLGTAPDSWGVWFPYTPEQVPWERYLDEAARAGYTYTELGPFGYNPTDPARLRDELAKRNLTLTGATVGTRLQRGRSVLQEAKDACKAAAETIKPQGAEYLIILPEGTTDLDGRVVIDETLTDDEWRNLTSLHDELGRYCLEELGLKLTYHSHADSHVGTQAEIIRLLENTDPRYVNLCLDTGHVAYCNADNLALIRQFPERIAYVHLKQVNPTLRDRAHAERMGFPPACRAGVMVEPPLGVPEMPPVLEALAALDRDLWCIVEQDMIGCSVDAPFPVAKRTCEYFASVGLGAGRPLAAR
jgi:inosose dehydratase